MTVKDHVKRVAPNAVKELQRARRKFTGLDIHQEVPPWLVEHVVRYQWANRPGTLLDAACGCGYGSMLLDQADSYVGIDLDPRALTQARDWYPTATFDRASIYELPYEDQSFDCVVSFETLEHVDDPARALADFHRVANAVVGSVPIQHPEEVFHVRKWTGQEVVELVGAADWFVQDGPNICACKPEVAATVMSGTLLFRT